MVDRQLAGGSAQTDEDVGFQRFGGDFDTFDDVLPGERALPGAQEIGRQLPPLAVVKQNHHHRMLIRLQAGPDIRPADPGRELDLVNLAAVNGQPLQGLGTATGLFVAEGDVVLAFGRFGVFDQGQLPLIVPAGRPAGRRLLEAAVASSGCKESGLTTRSSSALPVMGTNSVGNRAIDFSSPFCFSNR